MYKKPAITLASSWTALGVVLVGWKAASPNIGMPTFSGELAEIAALVALGGALLYFGTICLGRRLEARYELMFADNPSPLLVYDRETLRISAVNDAALTLYGYSREEFLRMRADQLIVPEEIPTLHEYLASLKGPMRAQRIWRQVRKDGRPLLVEIASNDVPLSGRPTRLCCIRDVTEVQESLARLQQSEQRYRTLTEQPIAGVYMLRDDRIDYINKRGAEIFGYSPEELTGKPVHALILPADVTRIENHIQRLLSGAVKAVRDEFGVRRKDGVEIVIGAHAAVTELQGDRVILGIMQDITEVARSRDTIDEYAERLERTVVGTLDMIAHVIELRDPYTAGHESRVGELAAAIGAEMGLDEAKQRGLRIAGAVHDVGKIRVPAEILTRPGKLSATEYHLVQEHAQSGYDILKAVDFPWPVAEVARQHHERLDGSGYPAGLKGDAIILEARIVAVADVVESMAAHRPYRPGLGIDRALAEIEAHAGTHYDPDAVAACLRLFRTQGYHLPAE
ncbi:HD domain-containing phosphohydrolase [Dongia sedimenti]|uniref:PAS domain S-box protein n=1 Tax=Dongia sedimenti TaxID=3064282 RepID=A0ABU0YKE2_9PROT|nr:PAS domain S-box protein [Rhodospirillaceae bacterium R-7]